MSIGIEGYGLTQVVVEYDAPAVISDVHGTEVTAYYVSFGGTGAFVKANFRNGDMRFEVAVSGNSYGELEAVKTRLERTVEWLILNPPDIARLILDEGEEQ